MIVWEAKTPGETRRYRWEPALRRYEAFSAVTSAVDSGTVTISSAEMEAVDGARGVTVLVAGGSAGETARISLDLTTSEGRTLTGVFQVPVRAEAAILGNTGRDIVSFAIRKIVGNGESAEAPELDDALERLNAMLMLWRISGMDIGVSGLIEAGTVLSIPDEYLTAVKYSLREDLHEYYGAPLSARDLQTAEMARRAVATDLLDLGNLTFEGALINRQRHYDGSLY